GDAGMNSGALLNGGTVIIKGNAGAFAGIDMKGGTLAVGGTVQGYLGANKRGGIIYAQGAKALPPSHATAVAGDDLAFLSKALGISQLHAMMFKKFM
ncbi:MAG: tributyrin esterase, partial [Euryarchaeota archaeon]|nr:tributyrin esterase [Euryarchaeota archaeon]